MRQFVIIDAEVLNPVFDLKGQRERKAKAALQRVPLQVAIAANGAEPMSCLESASAQSTNPPKCQILSWGLHAPNILAIDLGTQTGWATVSGFGSIRSGSRSFKLARDEAPGLAFWRFARWLNELEEQVQGFDAMSRNASRCPVLRGLGFERKKIREGSDPFWAFVPTSSVQITGKEPRWEQDSHRKSSLVPTVPTYC